MVAPQASLPIPEGCWKYARSWFAIVLPIELNDNTTIVVFVVDHSSKMANSAAVLDYIGGELTALLLIVWAFCQNGVPVSFVAELKTSFL